MSQNGMKRLPTDPGDSVADRSLKMVTALTAEVVVLRERLEIFETVVAAHGLIATDEIDRYSPDADTAASFKSKRKALIERVFDNLKA